MSNNVSVTLSGPIFESASLEMEACQWAVDDALGAAAVGFVQDNLDDALRHPSGWYRSHIEYRRDDAGVATVSDSGVIYGPWLEGVSHRNDTTRFKGYASFRKAAQQLEERAVDIAEAAVQRVVDRLNS